MKTLDITTPVMQKIVNFEKKRSIRWLRLFVGTMVFLLVMFAFSILLILKQMFDFQVFDLFSLLSEDKEVIAQFWQDTLLTLWAQLPLDIILVALVALATLLTIVFFTRTKRKIIKRKLFEVAQYQQKKS